MNTEQILRISEALAALFTAEAKAEKPFKFSGKVRLRLARLSAACQPILKAYGEARDALVKQYGAKDKDGNLRCTPAMDGWADFKREHEAMVASEVPDFRLETVSEEELNLEKNDIHTEILSAFISAGILKD